MSRVAVVIPTWNGRELLATLLPTLAAQRYTDFRTLVVDNGSQDGTAGVAATRMAERRGARAAAEPRVRARRQPRDPRGARGVRRAAQQRHGARPGLARGARRRARRRPTAPAPPPRSSAPATIATLLDGAGDLLAWTGGSTRRGIGEVDHGQYDTPGRIFSACAGAALYRRTALTEVGDFDETFESYLEDVDWALRRTCSAGTRSTFPPRSHTISAARRPAGCRPARYLLARNYIALIVKDYPTAWLARFAPQIAAELARVLVTAIRDRQGRLVARAWRDALRRAPATLERRQVVQSSRTIPLPALEEAVFGTRRTWRELFSVRPSGETFGAAGR